MRTLFGMILGALLLVLGVYVFDAIQMPSVTAGGQAAQTHRTVVNWDVAAENWTMLKTRAREEWVRIASK